jgi:hypothetical protein
VTSWNAASNDSKNVYEHAPLADNVRMALVVTFSEGNCGIAFPAGEREREGQTYVQKGATFANLDLYISSGSLDLFYEAQRLESSAEGQANASLNEDGTLSALSGASVHPVEVKVLREGSSGTATESRGAATGAGQPTPTSTESTEASTTSTARQSSPSQPCGTLTGFDGKVRIEITATITCAEARQILTDYFAFAGEKQPAAPETTYHYKVDGGWNCRTGYGSSTCERNGMIIAGRYG